MGEWLARQARSIPWLHPFPGHISLQVNGLHFLQFSRQWQSGVVATETGRPAEPKMTIYLATYRKKLPIYSLSNPGRAKVTLDNTEMEMYVINATLLTETGGS